MEHATLSIDKAPLSTGGKQGFALPGSQTVDLQYRQQSHPLEDAMLKSLPGVLLIGTSVPRAGQAVVVLHWAQTRRAVRRSGVFRVERDIAFATGGNRSC